jgi:hypothetical protein
LISASPAGGGGALLAEEAELASEPAIDGQHVGCDLVAFDHGVEPELDE